MRRFGRWVVVVACLALGWGCGGDDDDGGAGGGAGTGGGVAGSGGASGGTGGSGASVCEEGCVATLAADCSNGPPSQAECEDDCEALVSGMCGSEYQALQACAVGEAITCSDMGLPTVAACASEQTAFVDCLN